MKIYLDNCCYNRPYDDQTSLSISLETQAKLRIQAEILEGKHQLVWSAIEDYENAHNPFEIRRNAISQWRNIAIIIQKINKKIISLAEIIMQKGIKNKDALHLACAITTQCDVFLTVDKKILKTSIDGINIMNPIEFMNYEEDYNDKYHV
ncbi:MAG: PIN domain protein [Spirochaetales bacterium]|nr:PIN domain protein [Spirochaetales bacterium]